MRGAFFLVRRRRNAPHPTARADDEALSGEWEGYRSSRLGLQWRVIYRVIGEEAWLQVASITAHDYRRP